MANSKEYFPDDNDLGQRRGVEEQAGVEGVSKPSLSSWGCIK